MKIAQKPKFLPGFINFSTDPEEFDVDEYLSRAVPDPEMLKYPETRRELTRANPLLFALLYLSEHLQDLEGQFTGFSHFHLSLYKWASATWHQKSNLKDARDAFIAPRGAAKSTMTVLILPMWAACHGFIRFIAAYSDSETTIKNHIDTFKKELKENPLIKEDYPKMYLGKQVWNTDEGGEQGEVRDTAMFLKTAGGFIFAAKSISSNSLGLKVGARRPDFIVLDDVERQGGDYSPLQAEKRRQSIVGGILGQSKPLGARVVLIGTNLMIGSMIDGMIKYSKGEDAHPWVEEENFRVHWYRPFLINPDGSKRSMWPSVWPTSFLLEEEGKESFAVDFDSQPIATGGSYWATADFTNGMLPKHKISFGILSIDPAVTSTRKSDFTAMAVVYYSRELDKYEIVHVNQAKLTPAQIRERAEGLCQTYPEITSIYIETTQGGDTWKEILGRIPVKIVQEKPSLSKEMRASRALNVYQTVQEDGTRRAIHRTKFPDLEAQMKAFPNVGHDDLVDSVTQAICAVEGRLREEDKGRSRRGVVAGHANRLRR